MQLKVACRWVDGTKKIALVINSHHRATDLWWPIVPLQHFNWLQAGYVFRSCFGKRQSISGGNPGVEVVN